MPINVQCPQCNRQLGVPDTLIGKKVKCPSCQTVFTAEEIGAAAGAAGAAPEEQPGRPSARGDASPPAGGTEAARAKVSTPGIALIVIGSLGALSSLLSGCGGFIQPSIDPSAKDAVGFYYGLGCTAILTLIPCGLAIFGGIKMRALQSYTLALVGSIAALFIWPCCCIPGIAIGVWGIMTLNNPEVKAAFR